MHRQKKIRKIVAGYEIFIRPNSGDGEMSQLEKLYVGQGSLFYHIRSETNRNLWKK